ncbi:MAG: DUF2165 domain-containing protein [Mycobacteriales bacterium]
MGGQQDGSRFIERLGALPVVALTITAIMALQFLLIAATNWSDFGANQAFVHHVLQMDTTFKDKDVMWRAIHNTGVQNFAYVCIIVWESCIALVLIWASLLWFKALRRDDGYAGARRWASIGFTMVLLLFFGGFITIGGEYFEMWQSHTWNGLQPALRNSLLAGLGLILVHLPLRPEDRHPRS